MSISLLIFVMIPRNFDTHFAISGVGGQRMNFNFSPDDITSKFGFKTFIRFIKHWRLILKVAQKRMKCCSSSSNPSLQYLHILSRIGVTGRVYRPDSICNEWADTRYLVNHCLWFLFLIFTIYGSILKDPFNVLYKRNLLWSWPSIPRFYSLISSK